MRISCKGQSTIVKDHVELLVGVLEGKAGLIGAHLTPTIVTQTKHDNYSINTQKMLNMC